MANVTATEARRHFGKMLDDAQRDPVFISKDGQLEAVMISMDVLRKLLGQTRRQKVRPAIRKMLEDSIVRYDPVYQALSKLG